MIPFDLLSLLVTQIWQVTLLIVVVWVVTRFFAGNRPHLAHALWMIVLLKCLTPPIWSSPTSGFSWLRVQQSGINQLETPTDHVFDHPTLSQPPVNPVVVFANRNVDRPPVKTIAPSTIPAMADPPAAVSRRGRFNSPSVWLRIWAIGALVGLLVTTIRFILFLVWLRQSERTAVPTLDNLVRKVSKRLGINRCVRLLVLDNPVGPAVLGLLHPTIVLPSSIVKGKTPSEMEPLIAHELIHIRRGDLWWALVQTIAKNLFWFHPLVWFAARMATRESERCCDEETVASLGCPPAVYARCLLDVLEHKHRLRVAPALPGVRPVDITSARLERVMKMGNGFHKHTPVSVWIVMLMLGALVLPGAAFVLGQEPAKNSNNDNRFRQSSDITSVPGAVLPSAYYLRDDIQYFPKTAEGKLTTKTGALARATQSGQSTAAITIDQERPWAHRTFHVADLLETIRKANLKEHTPEERLLLELPHRTPYTVSADTTKRTVHSPVNGSQFEKTSAPSTPAARFVDKPDEKPSMKITDGKLVVYESIEVLDWISKILDGYREHGFVQIVVETRFVTTSQDQLNQLGVDWSIAQPMQDDLVMAHSKSLHTSSATILASRTSGITGIPGIGGNKQANFESTTAESAAGPLVSATTFVEKNSPVLYGLIDKTDVRKIIDQVKGDMRLSLNQAPTAAMFNGQKASICDMSTRPFVAGFKRIQNPNPQLEDTVQPVIRLVQDGTLVDLKATVVANDAIALDCKVTSSQVVSVNQVDVPVGSTGDSRTIQIPMVRTNQIRSTLNVPNGQTMVLCSFVDGPKGEQNIQLCMLTCRAIFPETPSRIVNHFTPNSEAVLQNGSKSNVDSSDEPVQVPNENIRIQTKTKSIPSDDLEPLIQACRDIGIDLDIDGSIKYEINDERIVIKGDDICLSNGNGIGLKVTGNSGEIEFRPGDHGPTNWKLCFSGNVEFFVSDLELAGEQITFGMGNQIQLKIDGGGTLRRESESGTVECFADQIRLTQDERFLFSGNSRVTGTDKNGKPINLAGDRIEWTPENDEFKATGKK